MSSHQTAEITYKEGKLLHNGNKCHFQVQEDWITVGCHKISREAAEFIKKEIDWNDLNPSKGLL